MNGPNRLNNALHLTAATYQLSRSNDSSVAAVRQSVYPHARCCPTRTHLPSTGPNNASMCDFCQLPTRFRAYGRPLRHNLRVHMDVSANRRCNPRGNNWRSGGEAGYHFPATGKPQNDILSQSLFLARSGHAGRGNSGKPARWRRSGGARENTKTVGTKPRSA